MGIDSVFLGRIEYSEHDYRNSTKQLEFLWQPFGSEDEEIFVHVLFGRAQFGIFSILGGYCYISGTAWEFGAEPVQDDPTKPGYNVKQIADHWTGIVQQRAASYITQNMLVLFGCDFTFMVRSS